MTFAPFRPQPARPCAGSRAISILRGGDENAGRGRGASTGKQIVDGQGRQFDSAAGPSPRSDGTGMKEWRRGRLMAPETVRFAVNRRSRSSSPRRPSTRRATPPKPWCRQLRRTARRRQYPRAAIKPGAPQLHPEAAGERDLTTGPSATRPPPKRPSNRRPMWSQLDITNNLAWCRTRDGAARGDSPITTTPKSISTLYTTSQNPYVARLVLSAFYNIAPEHKLRSGGARRRRRFRLQDLHLSGRRWWRCGPPRRSDAR